MRILIDYRPALRQRTGVGEYVHQTTTALVSTRGPADTLCLFSSSWKDRLAPDAVPGTQVVDRRIPVRALHLLWHRLEWPPVEWLAGAGIDIAQSAHPLLIPSRRAARLVTIYDLHFLDHPERTTAEIRRDYPTLAASHARRADQVIVISRHTAADVERRLGVPASRISVCTPGAPDWARREREPAEGGTILFLGTLEPRKNLGVLLDAYEALLVRMPHAPPLVLAGRITDDAAPLIERTRRAPLAGRVETPGYIAPGDREALYRRALVFVLPSHTEGFGMPAVEAMMVGVPVVAANRGALTESVGTAGVLVDPDVPLAFTDALATLLESPARRQALADAGRAHASTFTWRRTAESTRAAWHLALEHRAERHG